MKTCREAGDMFSQLSVACVRDGVLENKDDDHVINLSSPNASSSEWESVLDGFLGIHDKGKPGKALNSQSRLSPTRRFFIQEASGERKLNSGGGSSSSESACNPVHGKCKQSRLQASGLAHHHLRLRPGNIDDSSNNEKLDGGETSRAYVGRHNPFKVNQKTGHDFHNELTKKTKPSAVKSSGTTLAAGRPAVDSRERSIDSGGRKVTISGGSRCGQFDLLDRIGGSTSSAREPQPTLEVGASVVCAQTTVDGGVLKLGRKTQRRRLSSGSSEDETTGRHATAKRKHLTAAVIDVDEGESSDEAKTKNLRGAQKVKGKKKAKATTKATVIEKSNADNQLPVTGHAAGVAVLPPFHRRQRSLARSSSGKVF
jgi:hypothetical protein